METINRDSDGIGLEIEATAPVVTAPMTTVPVTPTNLTVSMPETASMTATSSTADPSSTSSDPLPQIVALFLVRFDVNHGNTLEYSKITQYNPPISLAGIEFSALPSGLHSCPQDVVYLTRPHPTLGLLEGVCVYSQRRSHGIGEEVDTDSRANSLMYSLGILCRRQPFDKSGLEACKNWLFVDSLQALLNTYLSGLEINEAIEDSSTTGLAFASYEPSIPSFQTFDDFMESQAPVFQLASTYDHPIYATLDLLNLCGPSIFRIWRSALLRERILLIGSENIELCCKLVYVISALSVVPKNIKSLIPVQQRSLESHPLYNITLSDMEWISDLPPAIADSFIATTTDKIMLYKPEFYDTALILDDSIQGTASVVRSINTSPSYPYKKIEPTSRDIRRFQNLIHGLDLSDLDHFQYGSSWSNIWSNKWMWLGEASVSSFLWWATAGEQSRIEAEQDFDGLELGQGYKDIPSNPDFSSSSATLLPQNPEDANNSRSSPIEVAVVGFFHQFTRRIFSTIASLIENQDFENRIPPGDTLSPVYITPSDINEMGLDPCSSDDIEFVRKLILLWWKKPMKFGFPLCGFCSCGLLS